MNTTQVLQDRTGSYLFYVKGRNLWCYKIRTAELPLVVPEPTDSFLVYNQEMKGFTAFVHGPTFYCIIQMPDEEFITMKSINSGKTWEVGSSTLRRQPPA